MPKDALYFSHDYGARNDPKLQELQIQMGMEGLGIYWCTVEMLHEQGGYLPLTAVRGMAYSMHVEEAKVQQVIDGFDLFQKTEDGLFYSSSALARLEKKRKISEARRAAGQAGAAVTNGRRAANAEQLPELDFEEAPEAPAPAPAAPGDTTVADMICSRAGGQIQATLDSYDGPRSDIELFFAVFHFEKGIKNAQQETARFIRQYQPEGWRRKGSSYPVRDRVALARGFSPREGTEQAYYDTRPLAYLRRVYDQARQDGNPERWRLIWEVEDMAASMDAKGNLSFNYRLSDAARRVITDAGVSAHGLKINFNE